MKNFTLISCIWTTLLLCSCGHQPSKNWPAVLSSLSGFTESQKALVIKYVHDLNAFVGHDIVVLQRENAYTLTFRFTDERELNGNTIGVAHVYKNECDIELSSELFADLDNYLKTTTWHEIGHCAGLDHVDPKNGNIMSPEALPFNYYGASALSKFKTDLLKILGVTK